MPSVYDSLRQRMCCVNPLETVLDSLGKVGTFVWRAPEGNIGHPCVDKVFVQEFYILFVGEST